MEDGRTAQREIRKVAEREWHQTRILSAALEVFAKRGYGKTSMQEVAETAGFSVGHIYSVIGKKESLFDEVLFRGGTDLENALRHRVEQLSDKPAIERLDALFDEILVFFDESPQLFQLFLSGAGEGSVEIGTQFSDRVRGVRRCIHEHVQSLLEEAQADHDVAPLDPVDMTVACLQIVNSFLSQWALAGYSPRARGKTETMRRIIWHGLSLQSEQPD
ncbi:hypothetical protein DRQ53_08910 [bacterium]|nr:MAG: hypothetical protein DRQ32_05185 [bacterium]RKZ15486.1 MAG: hypothetical protein DRQ53_08910 [bacterium]